MLAVIPPAEPLASTWMYVSSELPTICLTGSHLYDLISFLAMLLCQDFQLV
jgi:hypothetical protein